MRGKMCQRMSWILTTISKVEKEKLGAWLRWMVLPNIMVRALFCFFLFVQHFWAILIKFPSAKSHSYLNSSLQRNSRRRSRKPNFIFLEAPTIINAHKHRKDLKDDFFKEDSQLTLFSIFHFIQIKYPKIASIWTIFLDLITGKSSHFIFYRKSWWAAVFRVYTDLPTSGFLWNKLAFFLNTKSYLSLASFPPIMSSTNENCSKSRANTGTIAIFDLSSFKIWCLYIHRRQPSLEEHKYLFLVLKCEGSRK